MWSFEFRFSDTRFTREWTMSGRRADTWEQAWKWAGEWAFVNFENSSPVEIRLVHVEGGQS